MIAQDQRRAVAQVGDEPYPFSLGQRDALVVVVADPAVQPHRVLGQREQTFRQGRQRHLGLGVQVHHAAGVPPGRVDGAVDDEAGRVRLVSAAVADDVPVQVDLDQAGRGDLVESKAKGVDQEVVIGPGHPRGDVRVHEVVPAEQGAQLVGGGEVAPHCDLGRAAFAGLGQMVGVQPEVGVDGGLAHEATSLALGVRIRGRTVLTDSLASSLMRRLLVGTRYPLDDCISMLKQLKLPNRSKGRRCQRSSTRMNAHCAMRFGPFSTRRWRRSSRRMSRRGRSRGSCCRRSTTSATSEAGWPSRPGETGCR